jgi:hypothetical protein
VSSFQRYTCAAKTLWRWGWGQALGLPGGAHAPLREDGIDALTVRAVREVDQVNLRKPCDIPGFCQSCEDVDHVHLHTTAESHGISSEKRVGGIIRLLTGGIDLLTVRAVRDIYQALPQKHTHTVRIACNIAQVNLCQPWHCCAYGHQTKYVSSQSVLDSVNTRAGF